MMYEAVITTHKYVPDSLPLVDVDQFYCATDTPESKEYVVSAYSQEAIQDAVNAMRPYGVLNVRGDGFPNGNNPCGCGIPTCCNGELCGMPPRKV